LIEAGLKIEEIPHVEVGMLVVRVQLMFFEFALAHQDQPFVATGGSTVVVKNAQLTVSKAVQYNLVAAILEVLLGEVVERTQSAVEGMDWIEVVFDDGLKHMLVDMESLEAFEEAFDEADIVHTKTEARIVAADTGIEIEKENGSVLETRREIAPFED
jgi:hypothetical protein